MIIIGRARGHKMHLYTFLCDVFGVGIWSVWPTMTVPKREEKKRNVLNANNKRQS